MAVIPIDGMVRAGWMASCANVQQPTTTELNAGTALETFITPDGLDTSWTTGAVNAGNVGSTQDAELAGRRKPKINLTVHHNSGVDTAYNLLRYRTSGYFYVRRGIDKATAFATGQAIEVYPAQCGQPSNVKPQPDGTHDFVVDLFVSADAAPDAVVA